MCALSIEKHRLYFFLEKKLSPVNKVIKEPADSSTGVKQEATWAACGGKKIRFYILNKKVYSIFKKHINRYNTEVNVLFCL